MAPRSAWSATRTNLLSTRATRAGLLAYNLVRHSLLQSAIEIGRRPQTVSLAATRTWMGTTWLMGALPATLGATERAGLKWLRTSIARTPRVGNRPDRVEPLIHRRESSNLPASEDG